MFNDSLHQIALSEDGSYTAYSRQYDEHYHSTKDGALNESFSKHVHPAMALKQHQKSIKILDICFGLGMNTLATLYYAKFCKLDSKIEIYSPELDKELVYALKDFKYPNEFEPLQHILEDLISYGVYEDENFFIELYLGDAIEYINGLEKRFSDDEKFDIVFQDAFSPKANPALWSKEYFYDLKKIMKNDGILTTYSTAFASRYALHQNGFHIYLNKGENFRNATVASFQELDMFEKVDMEHKIACNLRLK